MQCTIFYIYSTIYYIKKEKNDDILYFWKPKKYKYGQRINTMCNNATITIAFLTGEKI